MKMAKPSARDIEAAEELHQVLQLIDTRFGGPFQNHEAGNDLAELLDNGDNAFDSENLLHLQTLYNHLARLLRNAPNFYGRVIGGMVWVIMNEANQILDPESDCIDLHPRFQQLAAECERLRGLPEGWKLVPVEPTEDMREAFHQAQEQWEDGGYDSPDHQWSAMLAATPAANAESEKAVPYTESTRQGDAITDSERLDFMLVDHRKVVVERLPHDNFEVYVEEGFMGDISHPRVRYSGDWEPGKPEALEIQREAIDAAISNTRVASAQEGVA